MSDKATFGVEMVRRAVQARADETSLHTTADEIGMSYTGLRGFLGGGKPHPRTRALLVQWYAKRKSGSQGTNPRPLKEDAEAALNLLVEYVRVDSRPSSQAKRVREIVHRFEVEFPGTEE